MPSTSTTQERGAGLINKSHYADFQRCAKLVWHRFNAPEKLVSPDELALRTMEQGSTITRLAQQLFPDGMLASKNTNIRVAAVGATPKSTKTWFELGFQTADAYARPDILKPAPNKSWDVIEVKSGTKVTKEYVSDLAFQAHVIETSVPVRKFKLLHIKSGYVKRAKLDLEKLFCFEDVTLEARRRSAGVKKAIADINSIRMGRQAPSVAIGAHCTSPNVCPLYDSCWKNVPAANVFSLYRGGNKSAALYKSGIVEISKIPESFTRTENQRLQIESVISNAPVINKPALVAFLKRFTHPLTFLDFETLNPAVPLYENSSPYDQIPFQFSCHIVEKHGAEPVGHGFIARTADDPRKEFMTRLRDILPSDGPIVVYNGAFEKARLTECANLLPRFKSWQKSVVLRFVDLLEPFQKFHYYHPNQHGSASLKAVLPVLTDSSYADLKIQNGATASSEFIRVTFGRATSSEKKAVWENLEKYCARDTLSMVWILKALQDLVPTITKSAKD